MNGDHIGYLAIMTVLAVASALLVMRVFATFRREAEELTEGAMMRDGGANFGGLTGARTMRLRGNGMLYLTQREVGFLMILPRIRLRVPLDAVRMVTVEKSFNGRRHAKGRFVVIEWTQDGGTVRGGFLVRDAEEWRSAIDAASMGRGAGR